MFRKQEMPRPRSFLRNFDSPAAWEKSIVVGEFQRLVHHRFEFTAVVGRATGVL